MLIVFASPFRILVTFAIVLKVRGISFFQILWTTYGRSLLDQKITTRVLSMSFPFYIVILPVLPFCMGCLEEMLSFARHINLCIHNSENYMFLELFLFNCIPTIPYQLIAKSMCAFVFIDAYYSCGPSSHSIMEWLGETNSSTSSISRIGSKQLYSADQNANPAFDSILPWSIALFMSGIS